MTCNEWNKVVEKVNQLPRAKRGAEMDRLYKRLYADAKRKMK